MKIPYDKLNDIMHETAAAIKNNSGITVETPHLYALNDALTSFLQDRYGVEFIEEEETATIRVRSFGATMNFSFAEFADSTIQDEQVAIEIAEKMLAATPPGIEYPDNEDPSMPEAYCTYHILDADTLRAQVDAAKKAFA